METSLPLSAEDLHHVLSLLARLGASSEPVAVRKRQLAEGLARLIEADIWVWGRGRADTPLLPPTTREPLLGDGWNGAQQKNLLLQALSQRSWRSICRRAIRPNTSHADKRVVRCNLPCSLTACPRRLHVTVARRDLICNQDWRLCAYRLTHHAPAGVEDFLLTAYPLEGNAWSTLAFWRGRDRKARFSARDRDFLHVVASEIDGLHRLPSECVPADGEAVTLSPRQHQVLQLLLNGEGNKAIARRLKLSKHTVCDYVKALHLQFKVSSRGELMARFVGGAATAGRTIPRD